MTWNCSCGVVNSGLNPDCASSKRLSHLTHNQVSINTIDKLRIYVALKEVNALSREMTDDERLFAQFFSHQKTLVRDMDDSQLRENREELRKMAIEAKAYLTAADDEIRERNSKKKNKQFVTTIEPQSHTDAINAVQVRAKRMTKIDKIRQDLLKVLPEETVNKMIAEMEKRATEQTVNVISFKTGKTDITGREEENIEVLPSPQTPPSLDGSNSNSEVSETREDRPKIDFSGLKF